MPICALDVKKAFPQGVSYEELAAETGEPLREVNFELPASTAAILQQVPGYETFDHRLEVLHCDKPGTGLRDAPRAFSKNFEKLQTTVGSCPPLRIQSSSVALNPVIFLTPAVGLPTEKVRSLPDLVLVATGLPVGILVATGLPVGMSVATGQPVGMFLAMGQPIDMPRATGLPVEPSTCSRTPS